jgi:nucleoside-diphosphate-sugar epimerase
LLCDYYHRRYGVDTRGVRFPGLISNKALPGGGTTDYAVHIYYEALKTGHYSCYIAEETKMDMMYMPDAIDAILTLMEADPSRLRYRNAYNITAMSLCPRDITEAIQKEIPTFTVDYAIDPMRQHIAESWPNSLDDSAARADWGFKPKYDLEKMTKEMLGVLRQRL